MATAPQSITVDVRVGPNLGAMMEVITAVGDLAELVPEWNRLERNEALEKIQRNITQMLKTVGVHHG